jgi:hypothetical protein
MSTQQNIFNLPETDFYDCYVERYQSNFQTLRIRVERFPEYPLAAKNILEIIFTGALLYSGGLHWTGANICLESKQACLKKLTAEQLISPNDDDEDIEDLLTSHGLFTIPTTNGALIQFIASTTDYALTIIA